MNNNNKDIDIIYFLDQIFSRWKIIVSLQVLLIVFGLLIYRNEATVLNYELNFLPMSKIKESQYNYLQSELGFNVNKSLLEKIFYEEFNDKEEVKINLTKYNFLNNDNKGLDFNLKLSQVANKNVHLHYEKSEEDGIIRKINFLTTDSNIINVTSFIDSIIKSVDQNVRNSVVSQFNQFIINYQKKHDYDIYKLESKFLNDVELYNHSILVEIEHLKEQTSTARKLNIKNVTEFGEGDKPYEPSGDYAYLRGYLILEEQIENLKSRASDPLIHNIELYNLTKKIQDEKSKAKKYLELLKSEFNDTDLAKDKYYTFKYDILTLTQSKEKNSYLKYVYLFTIPNLIFLFIIFVTILRNQISNFRSSNS